MSESGLHYGMQEAFGSTERLLTYYEFSGMSGRHIGNEEDSNSLNYGVVENCDPAHNTGLYSGVTTFGFATPALAKKFTTGTVLVGNNLNLKESNIEVASSGIDSEGTSFAINFSNLSSLIDFQFNGEVSDSVLFGSLEKISNTVDSQVITGAKGYNFGVTSRGKLFYQGFDKGGDFIHVADSIDLAKRNVVGFSVGNNILSLSRFDYLNNVLQTETFDINTNFISENTERFYLGGSPQYYKPFAPSGEYRNATGVRMNSFCLLSGYVGPSIGMTLGSGLIGTFFESSTAATEKKVITGYSQVVTFKTGITGYDYETTGTLNISTGQYMRTGDLVADGTVNKEEGELYFQYNTFELNGVTTFNKEQVGYLHPLSGYQYLPSGDGAHATLGLRDVEGAVSQFIEREGISGSATIGVNLYGSRLLTGVLSEISGVSQIPIYQTVTDTPSVISSGIDLSGPSDLFKKDYIYYKGVRK